MSQIFKIFKFISIFFCLILLSNCEALKPKKVDTRKTPINAQAAARKNIEEGKGVSIKSLLGNKGTNFEFSSSNPMWRASLDTLDFLPLTTVDYSGGVIITDWYNNGSDENESIKITVRFLSNEITSRSLKIIVHKKNCPTNSNCAIKELKSKINEELVSSILKKASLLEAEITKK